MNTTENITLVERSREAIELLNDLIPVVGLCAFGIPVTRPTITSTLAGWALIGMAGMQLCLTHLGSLADRGTRDSSIRSTQNIAIDCVRATNPHFEEMKQCEL